MAWLTRTARLSRGRQVPRRRHRAKDDHRRRPHRAGDRRTVGLESSAEVITLSGRELKTAERASVFARVALEQNLRLALADSKLRGTPRSKLKSISAIVRLFQEASHSFASSKMCSTKAGKFRDSSACPGFCAEITVVLIFVLVFGFVYLDSAFMPTKADWIKTLSHSILEN